MTASERFHDLLDRAWDQAMEDSPESATLFGERGHNHRWTDASFGAIERRQHTNREILEELATAVPDPAELDTDDDRLSYDLFKAQRETQDDATRFPSELMPVGKMGGLHETVPLMFTVMPRFGIGDLEDAVARLEAVSVLVDQHIGLAEEGLARGITPPRLTLEDIPAALDTLIAAGPDDTPMLAAFRQPPAAVADDPDELARLQQEAADAYAQSVVPALTRFRRFLADTYIPNARTTIAISDLPDGDEWYAHLVRRYTTTDLDPKQIHEIGQDEVARIRALMDDVVDEAGFSRRFEDFTDFLRTDDRFYFETDTELLAAYRDICKRVDPELARFFGRLPRLPYGVIPVPEHEAPSTTTAYYMPGSLEMGRAGYFFANTYDLRSRPSWEMEALALHEAVPGHHLQIALAAELPDLPKFRTKTWSAYTAYVEGWGLYAESLGAEMEGFYADPYSRFGQLSYEMWRAVRLVVDTGIHTLGWSREQAIAFFRENSGKPDHDIAVEVDRYISWPGQALAYKLGELKIKELRAHAEATLGDRFDIRAFHDEVLGAGALPLDVLESRVRLWAGRR